MDRITCKNKIPLWEGKPEGYSDGEKRSYLVPYLIEGSKGCVIVCPGGAYEHLAPHEGEEIARELNKKGVSAYVLYYRIKPSKYPNQLYDVLRAIRYVRYMSKKDEYKYYSGDKIAVMGFSAGGHLCVMASEHFDNGREDGDEIDKISSRPDAAILCYPVVTMLDYTHHGSRTNLLGKDYNEELSRKLSGELSVRADMPPVFAWHTADDASVHVMNIIMLCEALSKNNIPFELHIFPNGRHGLGLAKDTTSGVDVWFDLMIKFLNNFGW